MAETGAAGIGPVTRPLTINDFSGGMTDIYVDAPANKFQRGRNLRLIFRGDGKASIKTRPGGEFWDSDNPRFVAPFDRLTGIVDHEGVKFFMSVEDIACLVAGSLAALTGPVDGNQAFDGAAASNFFHWAKWNKHLFVVNDNFGTPKKIYQAPDGSWKIRTAGLPALASSPTVTPSAPDASSYIYSFMYVFEYTIGDVVFQDFGPVTEVQIANGAADPSADQHDLADIPELVNGSTECYDTATIKVWIFRTQAGGTTGYKIGEVTNGTTVFTDNFADADISENDVVYTDGDVLDYDPPPASKFITITPDGVAMYHHIKDAGVVVPNRSRQAIENDPDSVPSSLNVDAESEILGAVAIGAYHCVVCETGAFRYEGRFDELGGGNIEPKRITGFPGGVNGMSIIAVPELGGAFVGGIDGFYFMTAFEAVKISGDLDSVTYPTIVSDATRKSRICAAYNRIAKEVYFGVQMAEGSGENDTIMVGNVSRGISEAVPFTHWDGEGADFRPTALLADESDLIRGDSRGYIFAHRATAFADLKVDTSIPEDTWNTRVIIYDLIGAAMSFGDTEVKKWTPRVDAIFLKETNVSVEIQTKRDLGPAWKAMKQIRIRDIFVWGDQTLEWGDPDFVWNGAAGIFSAKRRTPKPGVRCLYRQWRFTNAYTVVENSDTLGPVTVDATAKTATLESLGNVWPEESVDYYLALEDDSYVEQFLVTGVADEVLTVRDVFNTLVAGSGKEWLLKAYRKNEVMHLLSMDLPFLYLSDTHPTYTGATAETGENA